jgi:hypothetical protein
MVFQGFLGKYMNAIKLRLLGNGRRGYCSSLNSPLRSRKKGNLIVECPIRNDAGALLQQFVADLYLIATGQKIVETIEIKVDGETIYQAHPIGWSDWEPSASALSIALPPAARSLKYSTAVNSLQAIL